MILAILLLSIVMGIAPMIVYASFLWWLDRWEKEPLHLLAAAFLWGFIPSAIGALIAQIILEIPASALMYFGEAGAFAHDLLSAAVIAPITEETIKAAAVLLIFIFFYREFDSMLDGILYGSLAGFGFAAIENILYFVSVGSEDPSGLGCLIFMRAFLFGLNHAFFTSLTGIGFAMARYQKNIALKFIFPLLGLAGAMFAHGLHNGLVTLGIVGFPIAIAADWMGALGVLVVALVSLYHEANWIKKYLAEEVSMGTLSAAQAATAWSFVGRIGVGFEAMRSGPGKWWRTRQFYQQCAELAYKKHQLSKMGNEESNRAIIEKLRGEVRRLSEQV
ncbi:MAG: PrsW family intramembrane metalloprotease [Chloroflexi bacterium]|nr:PrsW family intramembrane metalloprotease [Chloroflexota bacterium]